DLDKHPAFTLQFTDFSPAPCPYALFERRLPFDVGTAEAERTPLRLGRRPPVATGGSTMAVFNGTPDDDVLTGTADIDVLTGLDGDDRLIGLGAADLLRGGAGTDTADYTASPAGVEVDLAAGTGTGGDAEGDRL